ncbi:ZIP family metal transporter [Gaetbulibacter jejuensis]|uniref:ZIP family metal transporter n=1 Tax=Gaetbulibacter jejuensis TaxID=584607 RepID=A0ABN1JPG0_9FLAO
MNKYLFPVYAVILGVLIVLIYKKKNLHSKLLLSFSGAFLLALTLFELLPEVYHHLEAKKTGLLIMTGILIQVILEFFSKGAEHGHVHHEDTKEFPWLLFISLCIHSFLEGFPIHQHNDIVYGVLVHKIPIAIVITGFLLESRCNKLQVVLFLILFTAMTPLGTFISNHTSMPSNYVNAINAIVIGIFFHISTVILFESDEGHKFSLTKLVAILLGIGMAYVI